MKKKLVIPTVIAIIVLGLFIALTIVSKVYQGGEIPIQIMGALLGAIITAFITMILLLGQSQAEELKERNVRVFEEKTVRYNKFIDELWKIWEDRKVSLEELNELMKSITKDIILYTNKVTVDKILDSLNKIAAYAGKEPSDDIDKGKIQAEVFHIINQLAKELNLGGEITPDMQKKINELENSILPYLNAKEYKTRFLFDINNILSESKLPLLNAHYNKWFDGEYLFIDIDDSDIKIIIGPTTRLNPDSTQFLAFYIDYYKYPTYNKYRDASRGWRKDMLREISYKPMELVDFSNIQSVQLLIGQYQSSDKDQDPANMLVSRINDFYKQWRFDGKTIDQVSDECTKKNG